ncbi:AraC family transcriptional regulator [Bacteroides sp. 214]|uniref:AraC family transcriptional regulator n=1 Tax=Bacteroides sp. 214 TaxID=2302935 RepID=UPI0013CF96C1|nr:AraC family transcriptional regulator [Bacteroides sp. 214]NDW12604.1 AraC family transcriptional regulator [Bacteroides sp. 214]
MALLPTLLNVGHLNLFANWNWKDVYSPFARIYYVESGSAKVHIYNKVYTLRPGNLYLIPPFTRHDDTCDDHFSLYYVHFYESNTNKSSIFDRFNFPFEVAATDVLTTSLFSRILTINPNRHLPQIDPVLYDNMPKLSQFAAENKRMPLHSIIETQGILLQLLACFLQMATLKAAYTDDRINKCLAYIQAHTDKSITLAELANTSCLSEDHLIRLFKKDVGCTPLKYINGKKMERAQLLLLTTDLSVREIAMEFSIDNISYFNRMFKQHTGNTPSEYRNTRHS